MTELWIFTPCPNRLEPPKSVSYLLSRCQDPHILPLSNPSGQHTNGNAHSLNAAKQVTIYRDLSHYWVFYCFSTPSFVLLGSSAKSRCLGHLWHPSLLNRQVQAVMFFFKITIPTVTGICRGFRTYCCGWLFFLSGPVLPTILKLP